MNLPFKFAKGRAGWIIGAALCALAAPLAVPQLLAFPNKVETSIGPIYSERPLNPAMLKSVVQKTQAKLSTSSLADPDEHRPIFLTDGGWRWHWLALSVHDAFAFTRAYNTAVVVNRVNQQTALVTNGEAIGGSRRLSSVLAHEFTHGLIRRKYGLFAARTFPNWKVEGYCDFVAGDSSLTSAQVTRLEAEGTSHPALPYYKARIKVTDILASNGGSVDELFGAEQQ